MKYCPNPDCPFLQAVGQPAEYVDTKDKCSDCDTPLVDTRPDLKRREKMGWDEMVPIMHLTDAGQATVVESLLESAGIAYYVHSEAVQELFGVGRIGAGFNVLAGQPTLFVDSRQVDEARDLLEQATSPDEDSDD